MQDNININTLVSDKKPSQITNVQPCIVPKPPEENYKSPMIVAMPAETINKQNPHINPGNSPQKISPQKIIVANNKLTVPQQQFPNNNANGQSLMNNSINLPNPLNIEKEKWLTLESNEIYVIRNESINKANEWIYYKLQREKYLNKRTNPFAEKTDEERIKNDMNHFRKNFGFTKEIFSVLTNTKKKFQKKQEKLKKVVDQLSKEVKMNNYSQIKDIDIAKHYMYEMAKENIRRRPPNQTQNIKPSEENENK